MTLLSKCQIDGEDFVIFCGLLRKHELYYPKMQTLAHYLLIDYTSVIYVGM